MCTRLLPILGILLIAVAGTGTARARPALPPALTRGDELLEKGGPVDGRVDLRFRLFDELKGEDRCFG